MKILHITSISSGGAATAAIRQHLALLEYGLDSTIIFLHDNDPGKIPNSKLIDQKIPILKRFTHKLKLFPFYEDKINTIKLLTFSDYEIISLPESNYSIGKLNEITNTDIINLHWPTGLINYELFFKQCKKPIVWTLHDMNPFLGIFHYSMDEKLTLDNPKLKLIDEKAKQIKRFALSNTPNLSFVCPSNWMLEELSKIEELKNTRKEHIPYCIDKIIFKPYNKIETRKLFALPVEKKILLFVSENIKNKRKGFEILIEALKKINSNDYFLCAIGEPPKENVSQYGSNVKFMGKLYDEQILAKLYSAADCFILPSIQDNLPNVLIESLSCGTPVISFNTGGMKDVIKPWINGLFANETNANALSTTIMNFLESNIIFDSDLISKKSHDLFSKDKLAKKYSNLYESIC